MALLYQTFQNQMDLTEPWRQGATAALRMLNLIPAGVSHRAWRRLAAALELISRSTLTYRARLTGSTASWWATGNGRSAKR